MKEGIYAEAQQQFEAALKLDRSNSWVYYNLGLLFLEQRNWQQALDNLEASLIGNLKPSWIEVWAHIKRGNAYDAKGERNRAVAEYNKAVQSGIDYDNAQAVAKKYLATPTIPSRPNRRSNSGKLSTDEHGKIGFFIMCLSVAVIEILFFSAVRIISSRSNMSVLPAVMRDRSRRLRSSLQWSARQPPAHRNAYPDPASLLSQPSVAH